MKKPRRHPSIIKDRRGGVGLIFALTALPLMAMIGISVDYAMLLSSREDAQNAADSAVLAAIAPSTQASERQRVGQSAYLMNLSPLSLTMDPHLDLTITENGDGTITAMGRYQLQHTLFFAGIFGKSAAEVSGIASATVAKELYVDLEFWLDGSASMGVAADEAGRDRLRVLSRNDPQLSHCAFACHLPTGLSTPQFATSQERAHANSVELRIDVMKRSAGLLVDALEGDEKVQGNVRYRILRLATGLDEVLAQTNRDDRARDALRDFVLAGSLRPQSASMLTNTIREAARGLPLRSGNGLRNNPKNFVVLVTDGMQFNWANISPGPINPAACDEVKARGVTLAVIQLRYVPLHGDQAFDQWVRPHFNELGPALQACASQDFFFSADTPAQIEEAFQHLSMRIVDTLRLTR